MAQITCCSLTSRPLALKERVQSGFPWLTTIRSSASKRANTMSEYPRSFLVHREQFRMVFFRKGHHFGERAPTTCFAAAAGEVSKGERKEEENNLKGARRELVWYNCESIEDTIPLPTTRCCMYVCMRIVCHRHHHCLAILSTGPSKAFQMGYVHLEEN